jgi:hypothetical protein
MSDSTMDKMRPLKILTLGKYIDFLVFVSPPTDEERRRRPSGAIHTQHSEQAL